MELLRKHLKSCSFFVNFTIPMGEDVFDSCLKKLKIVRIEPNTPIINKGITFIICKKLIKNY